MYKAVHWRDKTPATRTLWRTWSFHPELPSAHQAHFCFYTFQPAWPLHWPSSFNSLGTHSRQAWLRTKITCGTSYKQGNDTWAVWESMDAMNKISYSLITCHSFLFYISKLLYVTVILYFLHSFSFSPRRRSVFQTELEYRANILYLF